MAEFSGEKVSEVYIDTKTSSPQDSFLSDPDFKASSFLGTNESNKKLSQDQATKTETAPNETAINNVNELVDSKSNDVPFVDIEALKVLENKAVELDRNLHRMMDNIGRNMSDISATSVQYEECYRDCVKNVGNATDTATKAMTKLIHKCEEMNTSMEPLYSMAEQVKMINVLLDQFEETCK